MYGADKGSGADTSRKFTLVFSNSFSHESKNVLFGFPIQGFLEINNLSDIIWYALQTSKNIW